LLIADLLLTIPQLRNHLRP